VCLLFEARIFLGTAKSQSEGISDHRSRELGENSAAWYRWLYNWKDIHFAAEVFLKSSKKCSRLVSTTSQGKETCHDSRK
jgi:hypothetical protein